MLMTCFSFSKEHLETFKNPMVTFKQLDLTNDEHVAMAFDSKEQIDYVVNLAAVTKFGLDEAEYMQVRLSAPLYTNLVLTWLGNATLILFAPH